MYVMEKSWMQLVKQMLVLQLRAILFVCAFLALVFGVGRNVERVGDYLQVLLPVAALGCAIAEGRGAQFFGRYLLLEVGIKGPKYVLGDLPINQRPSGGTKGFPSGHTAAATFGATALASSCMSQTKVTQGVVLAAAAFVGGSRIQEEKHTLWQAMAGGIWGWFVQAAGLVAFDRWYKRIRVAAWRGILRGLQSTRRFWRSGKEAFGAVALVGCAFAAAPNAGWSEVSIDLYTGWQTAPHSSVTGSDPAGGFDFTAGWEGRSFEAPPHYGIRAIWWRGDNWGITADFNHTKVYADGETLGATGTSGGFEILEFTDGLNALTFGAIYKRPNGFDTFLGAMTPYWGAGIGVAVPHVEVQTSPLAPSTAGYQIAGPAASGMVGVVFDVSDRLDGFAEYKVTYSQLRVDLDGGGRLETDIITNGINFGIRYNFD